MARCNDQKVSELIRRDVLRAGERDESEEKGYCFHRHEKRHALRRARSALGLDAFEFEIDVIQRRVAFAPVRNHHASHFFQSSRCQIDLVGRGASSTFDFTFIGDAYESGRRLASLLRNATPEALLFIADMWG